MIDREELAAYIQLLALVASEDKSDETVLSIVNSVKEPASLPVLVKFCQTVARVAEDSALKALEELRAAENAPPPPTPATVLSSREENILKTWRGGKGRPMPEVVADEIVRQFREEGRGTTWIMTHWGISQPTASKLRARAMEPKIAEIEAKATINGKGGPDMPAWAAAKKPAEETMKNGGL